MAATRNDRGSVSWFGFVVLCADAVVRRSGSQSSAGNEVKVSYRSGPTAAGTLL